ncbi:MAG: AAA family ATPase [Moorella sp. (in: firmicutes)]
MKSKLVEEVTRTMIEYLPYAEGSRHRLCLAVAGWLRKKGYTREEVLEIIGYIATYFQDEEVADRLAAVETTFGKSLDEVAGWSELVQLVGEEEAKELEQLVPRVFTYTDEHEEPLYRVLRYDRPSGREFSTEHFPGNSWHLGLGGTRQVLYRLPKVRSAIEQGETIFVVEGEKCVHALEKLGVPATTNPFGAEHWRDEFSHQLKGANKVVILPDNDAAGRCHAQKVLTSLEKHAIPAKIVELPGLGPGEDVFDLISRGEIDKERLLALVRQVAEPPTPEIRLWSAEELSKAELPQVTWLLPDLLPAQGLTVLAGRPKSGKSWLALDLALSIAAGAEILDQFQARQVPTLYVALEDSPARLKSRIEQAGLPTPAEGFITTTFPCMPAALEQLDRLIDCYGLGLVIVDTWGRFRPARRGKAVDIYAQDYQELAELKRLLDTHGIAGLLVHHFNKSRDSEHWSDRILGSTGVIGSPDTLLALTRTPEGAALLRAVGRDLSETELALKFENFRWRIVGEAAEVQMSESRREILEALRLLGGATPQELADYTGKPGGTIRRLLMGLRRDGLVVRVGGRYFALDDLVIKHQGKLVEVDFRKCSTPESDHRSE